MRRFLCIIFISIFLFSPLFAIANELSPENNSNTTAGVERPIYTGHEYDSQTSLSYMGARYYPGNVARFVSQDPTFQRIGDHNQEPVEFVKLLSDPQRLNSYSYSLNNPLKYIDPDGEAAILIPIIGAVIAGIFFADILPAQSPANVSSINPNATSKNFGELTIPSYENIPGGARIGIGIGLGILFKKPTTEIKNLLRNITPSQNNYRGAFQQAYGKLKSSDIQVHHTIPQPYRELFEAKGINIDDPQYLRSVNKEIHYDISSEWRRFEQQNRGNITPESIQNFAQEIENKYGQTFNRPEHFIQD